MTRTTDLRRELEAASAIRGVSDYEAGLSELAREFGHTISVLADGRDRIARFNCFAYALGVWDHVAYIQAVDRDSNSALIDSDFVASVLKTGQLQEIGAAEAVANDLVLYFSEASLTHAATVADNGVFRSKWGGNEVHQHALWEVPASYGETVRYFRKCDANMVVKLLAD